MLRRIQLALADELRAQGCPVPVVYGPTRTSSTLVGSRVVVERDRDAGDGLQAPRKTSRNPRMRFIRPLGARIMVFGQSTLDGADTYDHERVVDQVVDLIFVALDKIVRAVEMTAWAVTSSKLLTAEEAELAGITTWPGAIYRIGLTIDRGVYERRWMSEAGVGGEARPEVPLSADPETGVRVGTTTIARGPDGVEQTVCSPEE